MRYLIQYENLQAQYSDHFNGMCYSLYQLSLKYLGTWLDELEKVKRAKLDYAKRAKLDYVTGHRNSIQS